MEYFQTVARLEHMTRAAELLNISQPALSKDISLIESELNVKLFDRTGRSIRLNKYGRTFLKKVDMALTALEDGKREVQDMAGEAYGYGSIQLAVAVGSHLLPDLLSAFSQQHPHIHFHLHQHSPESASGAGFDLSIYSSPAKMPGIDSLPLLTEEILLAVPAGHRFAARSSVRLGELKDEGFISLRRGKSLRETTDEYCRQAGFVPMVIFESDDPATVRGLIRAGQGVAFIPAATWGGSTGSSVSLLSITEPRCERTIRICWPTDRYLTRAASLFRDFCIGYFAEYQSII